MNSKSVDGETVPRQQWNMEVSVQAVLKGAIFVSDCLRFPIETLLSTYSLHLL